MELTRGLRRQSQRRTKSLTRTGWPRDGPQDGHGMGQPRTANPKMSLPLQRPHAKHSLIGQFLILMLLNL
jgi:hypothetical protein